MRNVLESYKPPKDMNVESFKSNIDCDWTMDKLKQFLVWRKAQTFTSNLKKRLKFDGKTLNKKLFENGE